MATTGQLSRRNFAQLLGLGASAALLAPVQARGLEERLALGGRLRAAKLLPKDPENLILLNSNENPYGPSPAALEAMVEAHSVACRYPDFWADQLQEKLARFHGVDPEMVVVTCGSTEVLKLGAMAFLDPNRRLVMAEPTFEAIGRYARLTGAEIVKVPCDAAWRHDLEAMARAARERPGLVYLCNPNNPTGTVVSKAALEKFLKQMPADSVALVDEAYCHFADDPGYGSLLDSVKAGGNVVVARTFSKIYGMAGLRLGYAIARRDLIERMRPHQVMESWNVMACAAALASLDDREFVEQNALGFDDWTDSSGKTVPGFRTQILRNFRLGEVAGQTGVPAETILRLAREFAANRPALALGDSSSSFQPGTLTGSMAVHCLNVLMGSAGTLVGESPSSEAYQQIGSAPRRKERGAEAHPRSSPGDLWQAVQEGHPYRVESLLLCEANPSVQFPGGSQWTAALARVPFVVACTSFFDETAAIADLVLPAPHFLEAWDEAPAPPGSPVPVESLVQPAVAPQEGVRHPGDVLLTLAKTLGGNLQDLFPDADFAALVAAQSKALLEQKRGYVFAGTLESAWYRLLQHTGWWAPTYASAEELWEQMRAQGGWWDPSPASVARAPGLSGSRKFQFLPPGMPDWPSQVRSVGSLREDSGSSAQYPLVLEPFELLPLLGGTGAEAPSLSQSLGQYLGEGWQTWAEIHPETANRFGLHDQQWAWLESPHGRIRVKVRIRAGLHPGVIAVPIGLGRTHGTEWIKGRGANPADLLTPASETSSPWPRWWGERVRILAA